MAEENARLEEARKAQEEEQKRLQAEREAFEAEKKAQTEELRQKEIKIEAEKMTHQRLEELYKSVDHNYFENEYLNKPKPPTPEQQEIMRQTIAISDTIHENLS